MQINIINFIIHKVFTVFYFKSIHYILEVMWFRGNHTSLKLQENFFFFSALLLYIFDYNHETFRASLVAQRVKHLPAMRETWVWSLGWENSLEKEMATHSRFFAWRIPWTEKPGSLQSMGSQSRTRLSDFTHSWNLFAHCVKKVTLLFQNMSPMKM